MSGAGRALVIAHRGAAAHAPENSLAAFRAAAALGADAVELDVHAAADGTLVVRHDPLLAGRPIARLTAPELRAVRLPNGEPVPTLEEALAAAGTRLAVFVEVKALPPEFDPRLLAALAAGPNPPGYAVHSFDHRIVQRLGRARPALRRGVLGASYPVRPLAALEDTGATVLWQERGLVDRPLVAAVHAGGAQVFVWTVDDPAEMAELLRLGVDGVCTNRPEVARRVVDGMAG